ncbi:DUF6111 family protein [Sneathiella chinensis]|uniref:Uncharacterized protein n=1 Tax=Sneathiella chinensis TaxID=349750 RepID=A0ABQ5U216_9PROT|nr:DUF6111 family protein [Sneathiella chinensis]GLQ05731.1 hypothetical protein GCM10007924_09520 [Sneathiella chinensis]
MIRGLLFHLIPLLLPFVVYGIYLYFNKKLGGEKTWKGRSVAISTLIGLILMAVSLVTLGVLDGDPKDGVYVPPRFEDGKLIDSTVLPSGKD